MQLIRKYGVLFLGVILCSLILATYGKSAVRGTFGLAVQAATGAWTGLKDFSSGDNQTNGVAIVVPCVFDGTNCDRIRGDTTNGVDVDVTNTVTTVGDVTPSDGFANPTTASTGFALAGVYNGTTWDRLPGTTNGAQVFVNDVTTTSLNGATAIVTGSVSSTPSSFCNHTWVSVVTGAPTGVTINLEGSIDGTTYEILDTSITETSEMRHVVNKCVDNLRADLTQLDGGTSPTVTTKIQSVQ